MPVSKIYVLILFNAIITQDNYINYYLNQKLND